MESKLSKNHISYYIFGYNIRCSNTTFFVEHRFWPKQFKHFLPASRISHDLLIYYRYFAPSQRGQNAGWNRRQQTLERARSDYSKRWQNWKHRKSTLQGKGIIIFKSALGWDRLVPWSVSRLNHPEMWGQFYQMSFGKCWGELALSWCPLRHTIPSGWGEWAAIQCGHHCIIATNNTCRVKNVSPSSTES